MDLNKVSTYLQDFLQHKTDIMRKNLTDSNAVATDNLRAGIAFKVDIYADRIEGIISMPTDDKNEEYWQFVDQGVDGTTTSHGSPFKFKNENVSADFEKSIATWMKAKYGVGKGYDSKRGDFYGMGVSIKRHGIRATKFFSSVINDDTVDELSKSILPNFKIQ